MQTETEQQHAHSGSTVQRYRERRQRKRDHVALLSTTPPAWQRTAPVCPGENRPGARARTVSPGRSRLYAHYRLESRYTEAIATRQTFRRRRYQNTTAS